MLFFFAMFGSILWTTWLVASGTSSLQSEVMLFWSVTLPWTWSISADVPPWTAQFAFGLYSLMLTSEILALAAMLWFRPRAWCTFCPMGTLTQGICRHKAAAPHNGTP